MANFSGFNVIEEDDFATAWRKLIFFALTLGVLKNFGSEKEPKKASFNSMQCVILYGHAINQILRGEFHPQYSFGGQKGDIYTKEFNRNWFLNEYSLFPETRKFVYTYIGRLIRHTRPSRTISEFLKYYLMKQECFVDQLAILKDQLKEQVRTGRLSTRSQAKTWEAFNDLFSEFPPCLQTIQVIYLGNNEVEIVLIWRSRDLLRAWMVNLYAVVNMINREVIAPNNCRIIKITDVIINPHIYAGDIDEAKKISLTAKNPQYMFRAKPESMVFFQGEQCSSFFISK
jgi:thymidylate synthase